ncbi:MAG: thiopurine S-methyltransferase, partial [Thiolinea sp.]
MKAEFWHERWEKNQIGFHQNQVNTHLQDFWGRLDVPAGGTVFVPLCGKSSDMLWLRSQGYQVIGVELNRIAVQDFFAENDLQPVISQYGQLERW